MTHRLRRGRRALTLLPVALAFTLVAACGGGSGGSGAAAGGDFDEMIKIGINESVTGPAASNGAPFRDSARFAIDQVNADGGITVNGKRYGFEAVERDNETDPQKAIGIAQEFSRDGVKFVLGPGISSVFSPAFESMQGKDAADAAVEKFKPVRAAILLPNDPLGELHGNGFKTAFESAGVQVVYNERFGSDTVDFAPYITQLKALNPDVIVIGPLDRWVEPILTEATAAGLTTPAFIGSPGVSQTPFGKFPAITKAMVTMVTRAVDNPADTSLDAFRTAYKAHFEKDPGPTSFWSLIYFDSVNMLARSMQVAGTVDDLDAISKTLVSSPEVTKYPTRALDLRFDDKHQAHYPIQHQFIVGSDRSYVG
jgi:branched-chain amino acid transport system substrate-binding protein